MTYYPIIHDYNICEKYIQIKKTLGSIDPLSA